MREQHAEASLISGCYNQPDWTAVSSLTLLDDQSGVYEGSCVTAAKVMNTQQRLRLTVDGAAVTVNVRIVGTGPRVLFVHGWNHSGEIWQLVQEELGTDYETVAIDLPGFGASPPLERRAIALAAYARILSVTATKLSNERPLFGIVADSLGAVLTLTCFEELALTSDRFLLSGCPARGLPRGLKALGGKGVISASLRLLQVIPSSISMKAARILALGTVHRLKDVHPIVVRALLDTDPLTSEILYRELCAVRGLPIQRLLPTNRVVILRGQHDRIATQEASNALAAQLGARLVELPGVGHTPMIEDAPQYATVLRALLAEKGAP